MPVRVLILGSGAFAHACGELLTAAGAEAYFWLDRDQGHYGVTALGRCFTRHEYPDPRPLLHEFQPDLIIPGSLAWLDEPWAEEVARWPMLAPRGQALDIERNRQFAAELCAASGVRIPAHFTASDRDSAIAWVERNPGAYVVKNPNCSANSPIQAIVCDSFEPTLAWLRRVDDSDGIFLQEHMGDAEAGHFVAVSGGEIVSLVTNQEYKRAHTGNLGPLAQTPLAGIVERDPDDRYGLARELIQPLQPWLRQCGFNGILQVTGMRRDGHWHAIEYNVRPGVTTGPLLLQMLENPVQFLLDLAHDRPPRPSWRMARHFGASLSLAGHGYPHKLENLPELPVRLRSPLDCQVWWHHVQGGIDASDLRTESVNDAPLRIADLNACGPTLDDVIDKLYREIEKIHCQGSYYRLDLGDSLWPPGIGHGRPRDLIATQGDQAALMPAYHESPHTAQHSARHRPAVCPVDTDGTGA